MVDPSPSPSSLRQPQIEVEQPPLKKPKMSSTTTSDDEAKLSSHPKPRYKRRKIALFIAYCGAGYQGMQKNPGAKTIESDLEQALYLSGAVPEPDRANPKRYDWARAARTDKGVSAVGQVVSGRFYVDPPGLVERLNSNLANQIHVFGFKRTTASFNAKKFCDRRRYVYLLPVFALNPSCHLDRESVLSSFGKENELVRCVECSERGRKVPGIMGRRGSGDPGKEGEKTEVEARVSREEEKIVDGVEFRIFPEEPKTETEIMPASVSEKEKTDNGVVRVLESSISLEKESTDNEVVVSVESRVSLEEEKENTNGNGSVRFEFAVEYEASSAEDEKIKNGNREEGSDRGKEFCYGEEEKERFNGILRHYQGTHNFHNFTTRIKAEDPSARRYIVSFNADSVFSVDGLEFVKIEVVGQSFMLHQIRKMVGLAVAVMRNCAPEKLIHTALRRDINVNVPTAPEVGLYLDECFFSSYNQKWKDSHEAVSMEAYKEQADDFKMKNIYSHIASMELKEGSVALWLHSLNHRNYPDFHLLEVNGVCNNGKCAEMDERAE